MIRVLPAATQDVVEAALWYDGQREGLGVAFQDAVMAALERIDESPTRFPIVYGSYRRYSLRRFPFRSSIARPAPMFLSTPFTIKAVTRVSCASG